MEICGKVERVGCKLGPGIGYEECGSVAERIGGKAVAGKPAQSSARRVDLGALFGKVRFGRGEAAGKLGAVARFAENGIRLDDLLHALRSFVVERLRGAVEQAVRQRGEAVNLVADRGIHRGVDPWETGRRLAGPHDGEVELFGVRRCRVGHGFTLGGIGSSLETRVMPIRRWPGGGDQVETPGDALAGRGEGGPVGGAQFLSADQGGEVERGGGCFGEGHIDLR